MIKANSRKFFIESSVALLSLLTTIMSKINSMCKKKAIIKEFSCMHETNYVGTIFDAIL